MVEKRLDDVDVSDRTPLSKEALVSLLRLCLSSTTFYYNGTVYQQIFGTAMGSPVSVVVANIVMEHIEDLALSISPVPTVFWKRYVDDVLTTVPADQVDGMLAHINSIDQNIQFTFEREQEHVIPFLDVMILHNDDGSLSTKVYHKPTHTDQYLQFSSHHPTAHKRAVVSTLLKRAASHCSMNSLVREERSYVKETLQQNGYPERFLSPQCSPSRKDREEKDDPRSRVTIPYIQGVSESVTRILSDINVQVHMKPFRTLRRILSHPKDGIPDDDKSSIVYKINCHDCDTSYVGETRRALKTRVSEHRRAMEKRDFSASALAQHAWEHDHHIDWTSMCVLGVESHYQSRISREAIYIRRQPSSLNRDRDTLSDMYDFIIL